MLAITQGKNCAGKVNANVLPCKISFNGPVNASKQYWNVTDESKDSRTVYFRGRKLLGREMEIPQGYEGVVLQRTNKVIEGGAAVPSRPEEMDDGSDDGETIIDEVKEIQQTGTFDYVTLWDHELIPSSSENSYARGIEEWMSFADSIHAFDTRPQQ